MPSRRKLGKILFKLLCVIIAAAWIFSLDYNPFLKLIFSGFLAYIISYAVDFVYYTMRDAPVHMH